jgi:hypothetical protein
MTRSLILSGGGEYADPGIRSYDSAPHRELIARAARWQTGSL